MNAPAASQSTQKTSPHFERNMKLMRELGVEFYDAVPRDQLLTFLLPNYKTPRRILAWVHERTLCYPAASTFCVDDKGNALQQKDCLRSLNEHARKFAEKHGTKPVLLDKSAISRGFADLKKLGLVRFGDEQGRIYLCGKVTPTPEAYKLSDENSISPALLELLNKFSAGERSVIVRGLHERQAQLKDAMAAAVRKVRHEHRQAEDEFLAEHGISKVVKGKTYDRLRVPATAPTENHQVTDEELRVQATGDPTSPGGGSFAGVPASGYELHVSSTQPEISAKDQPPSSTAQASDGASELPVPATPGTPTADAAPQPPTADPTFEEWKQLYPVERLDEQKSDQIFKALNNAEKTKATDGLRSHLDCERWRLTPEYIPLASKFLKERQYDYAPPPYLRLKTVENLPKKNGYNGHPPAGLPTSEQIRDYLIANAQAVGAAGLLEIAETLKSLAADVEHSSNLEQLERLLVEMETKMVDALKTAQTREQLVEAARRVNAALQPHRGKMTAEQIEILGRHHLKRYLMDGAGLPRLSLLYMK